MYTLYKFHFLNGISEINQLSDDILIIWPAPVYIYLNVCSNICIIKKAIFSCCWEKKKKILLNDFRKASVLDLSPSLHKSIIWWLKSFAKTFVEEISKVLWDAAPGSTVFVVRLCVMKCSCVVFPNLHIGFSPVLWDSSVDAATCTSTLETKMERSLERSTTLPLNAKFDWSTAKNTSCASIWSMTQGAFLQLYLTIWFASAHRALCHKHKTAMRPFRMWGWIDSESITGHFIHLYP